MGLKHVVVTSVDRDDVPDRGAGHYAATIRALKAKLPEASVEVLTPDFLGVEEEALATVLAARPDVFNHNIETVRRLHRRMRGAKASYDKALWLLAAREGARRLPRADEVGDHRRPRRDERRGRRDDARPARARRRRRHDRPVPPAVARSTRRSTAGCTPTSSAGSASRARRSASARSSRARSCARATAPTSSATRPRPAAAPSPTRSASGNGGSRLRRRLLSRGPSPQPLDREVASGRVSSRPRYEVSPLAASRCALGSRELMTLKRPCQEPLRKRLQSWGRAIAR